MAFESDVEIGTPAGNCDAVFVTPEGIGRWPGILYLTDIGGIRPASRGMARRLAEQGFALLMPNLFYRTARPPLLAFKPGGDQEELKKRMAELTGPLTPAEVERDAAAYLTFLDSRDSVLKGKIGVVGFCFSGAIALRIAAALPGRVAAAASFHGGRLFTGADSSPHLLLPRVKAQLYFGHASNDASMPPEAIEKLTQALAVWGGEYESEVYEGAKHGWTVPGTPVYNEAQAERAFQKLTNLLQRRLSAAHASFLP